MREQPAGQNDLLLVAARKRLDWRVGGRGLDIQTPYILVGKCLRLFPRKRPEKAFHDLLAASVIFDRDICQFKEVEVYHEKNLWGCFEKTGSNTFISVGVDKERFWRTL